MEAPVVDEASGEAEDVVGYVVGPELCPELARALSLDDDLPQYRGQGALRGDEEASAVLELTLVDLADQVEARVLGVAHLADDELDDAAGRVGRLEAAPDLLLEVLVAERIAFHDEVGLGPEVMVEGALGHPGLPADPLNRDLVEALLADEADRGLVDAAPRGLGLQPALAELSGLLLHRPSIEREEGFE